MSDVAAEPSLVGSFLRRYRDDILAEWRRVVMVVPDARDLHPHALIDHIPDILDEIAELADGLSSGADVSKQGHRHAIHRLGEGFEIAAVVTELSILRGAVLTLWARENVGGSIAELSALNLAIDRTVTASVTRYAEARARTLSGLDRVSTVALEARDIDAMLENLLHVFESTTPSVDTVAVLLVKGSRLMGRVAIGLEAAHVHELDVPPGEGFDGRVASEQHPISVRDAYLDPSVTSGVLRGGHVKALYGVPLLHDGHLLGVAHMGSLTAVEFSESDQLLFRSMVARAASGIAQQLLREELAASEQRSRQAVAEREHALAKLEALLAASPVGIGFIDHDLRVVRINEALSALSGLPAGENLGRRVTDVYPDLADKLEPILRRVLSTGEPALNVEVTRHMPMNPEDRRSLLATYFPVRSEAGEITGVGGVLVDVTTAKRAQDALRCEQLRLESIIEHAPASIVIKDASGRIILANHRLASTVGHTVADIVGKRASDLLPPDIAIPHEQHDRTVLTEQRAVEVEEEFPSEEGLRTFLTIKFPIPGDLVGAIATEITERKRMEEELRVALRIREELLAVVSHDLRSPLGTIQLSTSLLIHQLDTDQRAQRHLDVIMRNCKRMGQLINDLLDSAKIRAGRLKLDVRRENASSVVAEALDLLQSLADEKGLQLTLNSDIEAVEVACDRGRILQVFGNLIGNAIKFCRAGDTITLGAERRGDAVQFSVADTGPGIEATALPRLFEAYWSGTEHEKEGAGLGLFIVRGIVERHGGKIWVESQPGAGATFRFTIPIAR